MKSLAHADKGFKCSSVAFVAYCGFFCISAIMCIIQGYQSELSMLKWVIFFAGTKNCSSCFTFHSLSQVKKNLQNLPFHILHQREWILWPFSFLHLISILHSVFPLVFSYIQPYPAYPKFWIIWECYSGQHYQTELAWFQITFFICVFPGIFGRHGKEIKVQLYS